MTKFSSGFVVLYMILNLLIYFMEKWEAPDLNLNAEPESDSELSIQRESSVINTTDAEFKHAMQGIQKRKRKNDDLGTLLRILTDNSEDGKGN